MESRFGGQLGGRLGLALILSLVWHLAPWTALSQPLDLQDPTPRWVSVRFEVSPQDQPGRLDARYGDAIRARFEPTADPRRVRVVVGAKDVEERLFAGESPRTNSFSDFVWVFDTDSGAVLSAELAGSLVRRIGFLEKDVSLDVRLTTRHDAGYRPPRRVLGQLLFEYCAGSEAPSNDTSGCSWVRSQHYDPRTGYVNAVGSVQARVVGIRHRSFAPLGEAIFEELSSDQTRVAGLVAP